MEAHVEATDVESRGLRLLVEVLLGVDLLLAWFLMRSREGQERQGLVKGTVEY